MGKGVEREVKGRGEGGGGCRKGGKGEEGERERACGKGG